MTFHELDDNMQLLGVIRALPDPQWTQMKMILTHDDNVKTFADVQRKLEMEVERIGPTPSTALVAQARQPNPKRARRGRRGKHGGVHQVRGGVSSRHGKRPRKRHPGRLKCFNCGEKGQRMYQA